MKFELILAVDSGDGQITNVSLTQMTRPDVSELATLASNEVILKHPQGARTLVFRARPRSMPHTLLCEFGE
jgi:hypothetical protein